ncbi:hypothetical protein BC749_103380 [Flavobacterium araucananum]|uniref:Uncharacterized protein n=1 Tax=Flavobacterium araucananum TaxID=946678 RepID=A0A227P539_9FLAO|nr:hypothetical protein [Flavobacterium araucananum]OXG04296.1 hypothetical protein B0A64_15665 [Flavobacterium araucananum]PWJ99995.1 hypothetical protein BC749_103380 [Flavobacterium araucananum]
MPQPQNVNPEKFKVISVLYNQNDFSISFGTWTPNNSLHIAMRWNDGEDGNGYPKVFAHPQWFLISNDIAKSILIGILSNPLVTQKQYLLILDTLNKI